MRKTVFILFVALSATIKGQSTGVSRTDAERFMAYFCDSIRYNADMQVCRKLYATALMYDGAVVDGNEIRPIRDNAFQEYRDRSYYAYSHKHQLEAVKEFLRVLSSDLYTSDVNKETDRVRAKRLVRDFYKEAAILPTFYQIIEKKYKGDTDAYVDALFDKSVLTNVKKRKKMERSPTAKKVRNDPGVLYTISKLQYLALIHDAGYDDLLKDVKGGTEVKE